MKAVIKSLVKLYYILFFRVEITGLEHWKKGQAKLICANHFSQHDPVVIGVYAPELPRFMAKHTLFKRWYARWVIGFMGGFPVNREINDMKAIKTTLKTLKNNQSVLIFPEGTRNNTTQPLKAKGGVAMMAIKSKVPIQPVTIDSTYKLFSKIKVNIHPLVDFSQHYGVRLGNETYQELTQKLINDIYAPVHLYKGRMVKS